MDAEWNGTHQRIGADAPCHKAEVADQARSNRPLGHHDRSGHNGPLAGKRSGLASGRSAVRAVDGRLFCQSTRSGQQTSALHRPGQVQRNLAGAGRGTRPVHKHAARRHAGGIHQVAGTRVPSLPDEDAHNLPQAIAAMVAACITPSNDGMTAAREQMGATLKDKALRILKTCARTGSERTCCAVNWECPDRVFTAC